MRRFDLPFWILWSLTMNNQRKRIRVLHVVPSLETGGRERSVLQLLKQLDPATFEAAIVSLFPYSGTIFQREAATSGVRVFYLPKRVGLDLGILTHLNQVIRSFVPDIVHSHLYILHYVLPVCVWNNVKVRLHTFGNSLSALQPKKWQQLLHRLAFQRFGFVPLAISQDIQASIQAFYGPLDAPLIRNGTDTARFAPRLAERNAWRRQQAIAPETCVFVNVARFHRQKNHGLLIDAFHAALKQAPKSLLLLVGNGSLQPTIQAKVVALDLQENIRFLGERGDIEDILNASDVVVSASDWEGLPNNLVEALAAGKAVVATNVGGVSEVVIHGKTGFLVPPGSQELLTKAILVLYHNRTLAEWMGNNGRQVAQQQFDVCEMAHQYGKLYLKLLETAELRPVEPAVLPIT